MPQANAKLITPPLPRALSRAAAKKISAAIEAHLEAVEALTTFLDEANGDSDEEPDGTGNEPSLGSSEWNGARYADSANQEDWSIGQDDDREQDAGDEGEAEPEESWLAPTVMP